MAVHPNDLGDVVTSSHGVVVRKSQGQYWVRDGERDFPCAISNRLRKQLIYPIADPGSLRQRVVGVADIRELDPVAIGDMVRYVDAGDGSGQIAEVLPRRNKLVRRAAGPKPLEQVIVANVDQVVAVFAAAFPTPKWELLDRYLAAAESRELPALICMTKLDLAEPGEIDDELANFERIGYQVLVTSAVTGEGIDRLRDVLRGRFSVVVGKSGVGKTSLLNALQPGLGLKVNEVSEVTGKGKHTTTSLQMFDLEVGGSIVDTPGMREFGLWDVEDGELGGLFPEFRDHLVECRFGSDCSHDHEPGCGVQAAVAAGTISERRYLSYLRLRNNRD